MNKILVWDLPVRLFHFAFAASLTAALAIGFLVDDDHPLFQLHMLFGIVALFLLLFRLIMGIVGSRYARFSSYPLRPREVIGYLISAVISKTKTYAGNNPGSALAAVLMFLLVPALVFSGIGVGGVDLEEIHETFAWGLLAVIVMHLAGLAWHTMRHRENIALAMVTGKKAGQENEGISSHRAAWGLVMALICGVWIALLFSAHDPQAATVKLPGTAVTVRLGENESHGKSRGHHHDDD